MNHTVRLYRMIIYYYINYCVCMHALARACVWGAFVHASLHSHVCILILCDAAVYYMTCEHKHIKQNEAITTNAYVLH